MKQMYMNFFFFLMIVALSIMHFRLILTYVIFFKKG